MRDESRGSFSDVVKAVEKLVQIKYTRAYQLANDEPLTVNDFDVVHATEHLEETLESYIDQRIDIKMSNVSKDDRGIEYDEAGKILWKTKEGKRIRIEEMTDKHLKKALQSMDRSHKYMQELAESAVKKSEQSGMSDYVAQNAERLKKSKPADLYPVYYYLEMELRSRENAKKLAEFNMRSHNVRIRDYPVDR